MTPTTQSLIGGGFDAIIGTIFSVKQEKEQKKLEERIAKMSEVQKLQLEQRMMEVNSIFDRQKLLFEALSVELHDGLIQETKRKRDNTYLVAGGLFVALFVLVMYARKRK